MKVQDIRSKTLSELQEDLLKLRKELFNMRFQKHSGALEQLSRISVAKKNIARIKTILTEKNKNIR